jgi:peptidoglycan/LPS O-acetylase OafA/YrhL
MEHRLPQLDGLRGIAILIVLLGHLIVFGFGLGIPKFGPLPPAGVDLFFVLSGFLITGILLRTKDSPGYFRNFYARRGLRVWPLYYLFLAFMFLFAAHHVPTLSFDPQKHNWLVFALYLQNIYHTQDLELAPFALTITWSLAVEEQFYLIWPTLVALLKPRNLVAMLVGIILCAPIARAIVPHFGINPYFNPLCRFDAMAMGSLLATWIYCRKPDAGRIARSAWLIIGFAAIGEVVVHFMHLTHIASKSMVSAAFTAVLALALSVPGFAKALSFRPLAVTGKISYCIYLVHVIVARIAFYFFPEQQLSIKCLRCVLILAGTYSVAGLSWHFIETPILRLKRFFQSDPTQVASESSGMIGSTQTFQPETPQEQVR